MSHDLSSYKLNNMFYSIKPLYHLVFRYIQLNHINKPVLVKFILKHVYKWCITLTIPCVNNKISLYPNGYQTLPILQP